MKDSTYEPPREFKDIPIAEAVPKAQQFLDQGMTIFFKFTCDQCGERCIFQEANTLYEKGECSSCGYETVIEKVGFMVTFTIETSISTNISSEAKRFGLN